MISKTITASAIALFCGFTVITQSTFAEDGNAKKLCIKEETAEMKEEKKEENRLHKLFLKNITNDFKSDKKDCKVISEQERQCLSDCSDAYEVCTNGISDDPATPENEAVVGLYKTFTEALTTCTSSFRNAKDACIPNDRRTCDSKDGACIKCVKEARKAKKTCAKDARKAFDTAVNACQDNRKECRTPCANLDG